MINIPRKICGRYSCWIEPIKIITATVIQPASKRNEIILKAAADDVNLEKTVWPPHPGVTKPSKQKSVATPITARIAMSIVRSFIVTGGILAKDVETS